MVGPLCLNATKLEGKTYKMSLMHIFLQSDYEECQDEKGIVQTTYWCGCFVLF